MQVQISVSLTQGIEFTTIMAGGTSCTGSIYEDMYMSAVILLNQVCDACRISKMDNHKAIVAKNGLRQHRSCKPQKHA